MFFVECRRHPWCSAGPEENCCAASIWISSASRFKNNWHYLLSYKYFSKWKRFLWYGTGVPIILVISYISIISVFNSIGNVYNRKLTKKTSNHVSDIFFFGVLD